mmetsp:Transcript_26722/g.48145  ORF Transcript_26722/g.48145 Transcript_26722/m.48145 type:complete len:107 (+) Transcript_26722:204-524(+)
MLDNYYDPFGQLAGPRFETGCKVTELILQDRPKLKDLTQGLSVKAQIAVSRLLRATWGHFSVVLTKKVLLRGISEQASFKKTRKVQSPLVQPQAYILCQRTMQPNC